MIWINLLESRGVAHIYLGCYFLTWVKQLIKNSSDLRFGVREKNLGPQWMITWYQYTRYRERIFAFPSLHTKPEQRTWDTSEGLQLKRRPVFNVELNFLGNRFWRSITLHFGPRDLKTLPIGFKKKLSWTMKTHLCSSVINHTRVSWFIYIIYNKLPCITSPSDTRHPPRPLGSWCHPGWPQAPGWGHPWTLTGFCASTPWPRLLLLLRAQEVDEGVGLHLGGAAVEGVSAAGGGATAGVWVGEEAMGGCPPQSSWNKLGKKINVWSVNFCGNQFCKKRVQLNVGQLKHIP